MNAYVEEADLILISESGFVEGAQPYIEGYTQCGNVAKMNIYQADADI